MKKMKMQKKGISWSSFVSEYERITGETAVDEITLYEVDTVYVDNDGAVIFHEGTKHSLELPKTNFDFVGDGLRIGTEFYPVSQKVLLDIANACGLKGEGLSVQCRERSALISKLLFDNEEKYYFSLQRGVITSIKKNVSACPTIKQVVECLPSRNVHLGVGIQPKVVREWQITEDFYKVNVEYACLGATDTLMPYCIVQDSDTGESSLTITMGVLLTKDNQSGFLPMVTKQYYHNKKVATTEIYSDINFYVIDQMIALKNTLENTKTFPAEEITLSKEFLKVMGKQRAAMIDFSGNTLYDQILSIVTSVGAAIKDLQIKQINSIQKALFEEILALMA